MVQRRMEPLNLCRVASIEALLAAPSIRKVGGAETWIGIVGDNCPLMLLFDLGSFEGLQSVSVSQKVAT